MVDAPYQQAYVQESAPATAAQRHAYINPEFKKATDRLGAKVTQQPKQVLDVNCTVFNITSFAYDAVISISVLEKCPIYLSGVDQQSG